MEKWNATMNELFERMRRHRQHLHQHPEVGLELPDTHSYIEEQLLQLGYKPEHIPAAGLTVSIEGSGSNPVPLIMRSDMDALPVEESSGESVVSARKGAMHACGHDLHMAMLLGVADFFSCNVPDRDLILAFQPGEESDRGALETLKHHNLGVEKAECFALHVNSVLPAGEIYFSRDIFMAHGDWFEIELNGEGGHASAPERVGNPIRAGAQIEEQLVEVAKKLSAPDSRVVATVTEFLSGNTVNVIPTSAKLRGTIRTVSHSQRDELHAEMGDLVKRTSKETGLEGRLTIHEGYPAVECDGEFVDRVLETLASAGLGGFRKMDHPSMVIEDFSYFLRRWPGAMMYLGASTRPNAAFNHSAKATFDERVMTKGFEIFKALAMSPSLLRI